MYSLWFLSYDINENEDTKYIHEQLCNWNRKTYLTEYDLLFIQWTGSPQKMFFYNTKGGGEKHLPIHCLDWNHGAELTTSKAIFGVRGGGGSQRIPQRFIGIWEVCFNWLQHALKLWPKLQNNDHGGSLFQSTWRFF